jgi:hypothetical protein
MFSMSSMEAKPTLLFDASLSSPPTEGNLNACKLLPPYTMRLIANIRSPILTYHRQGTIKGSVGREDHAVIYTGPHPPILSKGEPPLLLRSVRVIPKTPRDKLEKESRINYGKISTVEHNVKAHFIGQIADSSHHSFISDFDATWFKKRLFTEPTEPEPVQPEPAQAAYIPPRHNW